MNSRIASTLFAVFFCVHVHAASYPPNVDYGTQGDFLFQRGVEFGRTTDLMLLGPVLLNYPEIPGSSQVGLDAVRHEDTVWDLSNLDSTGPEFIASITPEGSNPASPINAHGNFIRFVPGRGAFIGGGVNGSMQYDPNEVDQLAKRENISDEFNSRAINYSGMTSPYFMRNYWEYNFDFNGLFAIRDTSQEFTPTAETEAILGASQNTASRGSIVVAWDHIGLTNVTGFSNWLGNLLVISSDQVSRGMAIYDTAGFKEGIEPRLLSVFQPVLHEPNGAPGGIGLGGYWVEPYGTTKMVWAARARGDLIPARLNPAMYVVDFVDPTNPRLTCELYFNQDKDDPSDGDESSNPMYVNFQDNYAYVDHFKVDIDACELAYEDGDISPVEFHDIVYTFQDIDNGCEASQYFRPLGQVGIFGGYDWFRTDVNEQGMCFFVTSDEPDTNPPYVSGHRPLAGQINYPVDGFIHIHIPETLRTETVTDAITVIDDEGDAVDFRLQLSHTGTLSLWPTQDLKLDMGYTVSLTGIEDYMGNVMDDYAFGFSTGDQAPVPTPTPVAAPSPTPTVGPTPIPTPNPVIPSYAGTPYFPLKSSQLACEPELVNGAVWVVNPDNDSVAIVERVSDPVTFAVTSTLVKEIKLNYQAPTSVTKVGDVFAVTYRDDDKVVVFDARGFPLRSIDTGHGTQPIASLSDGEFLYVSLYASGEVMKIDADNGDILSRLYVGPTPKAMALHNGRLLVARFISTPDRGEVYDINVELDLTLDRIIEINKISVPDDIDHGSGVPNYLSSIVINAEGTLAYVTANKANIDRGLTRNGQALDDDNTIRPMIASLDLLTNSDVNIDPATREGSTDLDNGADPAGIIFLANPAIRMHSLQGNNIVVGNDFDANRAAQFSTGSAPQEMCATLRSLYVKNFTDRTISVIDIAGFMFDGALSATTETVSTVTDETLSEQELLGLQLFYHARIPDISPEGYMSCASCHANGGHDGMVWDLSSLGEGFRNTLSLNGSSGTRFGDLHWSGNFDEVQDFEIQIEKLNGAEGLIPGVTFADQSPLNYITGGQSDELDALAAYVGSLGKGSVKHSPYRTYVGELSEAAKRGKNIFENDNCADCHAGEAFRDGRRHDVGTIQSTSGNRLGGELLAIRTPSLIHLWDTAPYFHDGSALTLSEVLAVGDHARDLTSDDEADLIQYLLSIDRELYIDDDTVFIPLPEEEP
ncbi:MAG: hypothetical protein ACI9Y1_000528 [Lentisphaeria bacterium]|jgi:hypothetical protein